MCAAADEEYVRKATRQAARQWHVWISTWMEEHASDYLAVNSEKTIFMKHAGEEWIMHGLFVDDTIHAATSHELQDEFLREYREDFYITLEDVVSTFLGMEIKHNKENLVIHLDTYIQETLAESKEADTVSQADATWDYVGA